MQEASTLSCKKGEIPKKDFTFPLYQAKTSRGRPLRHGCRRASVSAAASGAVCQWQTSSTDRRGSGDRPLGNVPPGRSDPRGGAKYVRRQKLAQSQVSPPPLGGAGAQWAPFSAWSPLPRRSVMGAAHWAASPEPAGESAPVGDGEGQPKVAPRPKIGKVTS